VAAAAVVASKAPVKGRSQCYKVMSSSLEVVPPPSHLAKATSVHMQEKRRELIALCSLIKMLDFYYSVNFCHPRYIFLVTTVIINTGQNSDNFEVQKQIVKNQTIFNTLTFFL
jgi:hypothetical protein